jgi:hypothetical protein
MPEVHKSRFYKEFKNFDYGNFRKTAKSISHVFVKPAKKLAPIEIFVWVPDVEQKIVVWGWSFRGQYCHLMGPAGVGQAENSSAGRSTSEFLYM